MSERSPDQSHGADDEKARKVELVISLLLRVGVVVSLLVVAVGMVITFIHHPDYLHSHAELSRLVSPERAVFPHRLGAMITGVRHDQGRSIVVAGLLLLIATPVMRVAVSIFAFIYERDRIFVVLTSIVLALLLLSFFLGKGE